MSFDTSTPLRNASWLSDGIAISEDGHIVVGFGTTCMSFTPEYFRETLAGRSKLERKIEELQFQVNAREPSRVVPEIIEELKRRADFADMGRAGRDPSHMRFDGVSYGLRDAIALIESKIKT